jgi:hypothetical protein
MRFGGLFCFLFAVAGICAAQETNFTLGPQYLITTDSMLFLHPIATPSLSLSAPPTSISVVAAETSAAPETGTTSVTETPSAPASSALPPPVNLSHIFWGSPETGESAGETSNVIEIRGAETPANVPASIVNVGVGELTDAQSLRERGYGVTVSEASSFWKTHKPHAPRVYTNRDIVRLHGGA